MNTHSQIGASQCYRWFNCPGSVALCSKIPPQPPSPYAAEGTAAHELAERCITEQKAPSTLVGQKAKNGIVFNTEMAKHVNFYLSVIANDAKDNGIKVEDIHFEHHFTLPEIDEEARGTCDAWFTVPFGKLYVYDLKYGAGMPVKAENNLQMQYYALGALRECIDAQEVEMVIVQPRTEESVKRWVQSLEDMNSFSLDLKMRISKTRDEYAALLDGSWCKWCPALATCPQVSKKVVEVAQQDFASPNPLPEPGALTPTQLKLVLDKAELLTDWLTAVESYAKSIIEAGTKVDGWKLVPKRAHRKWKDEFEVETALADQGDRIYDKKLKTPKQMEAVVGKEKVAELSETPDNGTTLAKDEDQRIEAKSDFTKIETTKPKKERKNGKSKSEKGSDTDF